MSGPRREKSDFRFRGDLIRGYFGSRSGACFLLGLPTILVGVGIILCYGWVRDVSSRAVPMYARQYDKALESEDEAMQRVTLRALVQLAPREDEYRYQLAMLKLKNGEIAESSAILNALAERGFRKASLWSAHRDLMARPVDRDRVLRVIDRLLPSAKEDPEDFAAHALLGQAYLLIRQPDLALPHYRMAVRKEPKFWVKYAQLLTSLGRSDEAKRTAEQATVALQEMVAANPSDVPRRIQWAYALRTQGQVRESLTALSRGLELNKDSQPIKDELAQTMFESALAERQEAIVDYSRFSGMLQQAYQLAPEKLAILSELSEIPREKHELGEKTLSAAGPVLKARLEEKPDSGRVQRLMAWYEFQTGAIDAGIERLRRVSKSDVSARLELAAILLTQGRSDAARTELSGASEELRAKLATDSTPETRFQLARALTLQNRWEDAIAVLDAGATAASDSASPPGDGNQAQAESRITSARILYRLRFFQELESDSQDQSPRQLQLIGQVLKIDPENRLAIAGLGQLASRKNRTAEVAQRGMLNMLAAGKTSLLLHLNLGTNYLEQEKFTEAIRHLGQAARLAPDDPLVANNLAFAIARARTSTATNLQRALALADQALDRLPDNPNVLTTRGAVLLRLEQYEDALHSLELSLKQDPANAIAHQYLADTYSALGNNELADVHRKRAARNDAQPLN